MYSQLGGGGGGGEVSVIVITVGLSYHQAEKRAQH